MKPFLGLLYSCTKYNRHQRPLTIVEIGVCRGFSTDTFLQALFDRKYGGMLYSIDKRSSRYKIPKKYERHWTFIQESSFSVEWNKPIDLLMIDGDRTYNGTKKDFDKFVPFVRDDGLIFMHELATTRKTSYKIWPEINYPKIVLPYGRNGLGVISKKDYWEGKI